MQQDVYRMKKSKIFSAQIWDVPAYKWVNRRIDKKFTPLIYEAHVGMGALKSPRLRSATFQGESPRIADLGYEYTADNGNSGTSLLWFIRYQVSSFFAVSSRFGTPEDFKRFVDAAHGYGIAVIIDLIHSHAVSNAY